MPSTTINVRVPSGHQILCTHANCNKRFTSMKDWALHQYWDHDVVWQCVVCDSSYKEYSHYRSHVINKGHFHVENKVDFVLVNLRTGQLVDWKVPRPGQGEGGEESDNDSDDVPLISKRTRRRSNRDAQRDPDADYATDNEAAHNAEPETQSDAVRRPPKKVALKNYRSPLKNGSKKKHTTQTSTPKIKKEYDDSAGWINPADFVPNDDSDSDDDLVVLGEKPADWPKHVDQTAFTEAFRDLSTQPGTPRDDFPREDLNKSASNKKRGADFSPPQNAASALQEKRKRDQKRQKRRSRNDFEDTTQSFGVDEELGPLPPPPPHQSRILHAAIITSTRFQARPPPPPYQANNNALAATGSILYEQKELEIRKKVLAAEEAKVSYERALIEADEAKFELKRMYGQDGFN